MFLPILQQIIITKCVFDTAEISVSLLRDHILIINQEINPRVHVEDKLTDF